MEPRGGRDSIVVAQVYYPYYSPPAVAQFPHGSLNDVQTLQTNVAPYFSNGGTKNKHSKAERVIPLQSIQTPASTVSSPKTEESSSAVRLKRQMKGSL